MTAIRLLLVDDDDRLRERLGRALAQRGYHVLSAGSFEEAIEHARNTVIDRAVLDLRMPGKNGLSLIRELSRLQPEVHIIVLTGYGSIATTVEAMRLGARNYLTKPCDADRILAAFEEPAPASAPEGEPKFEVPSLAKVEREHIERVLQECGGNISKAARILGMHRRTLQYKLAKFSVTR